MPRFLVHPEDICGQTFTLTGSEARHAALVLRKKAGDEIDLFDGKDLSYRGQIRLVSSDRVEGLILEKRSSVQMSTCHLTLYQALIKGPKWDWLVEKASEIGITRLAPVATARTIVKASGASFLERSKRIALSAAKQCGRNDVLEIVEPKPFVETVRCLPANGLALIPWEKETEKTIKKAMSTSSVVREAQVSVFIGPEGGWEPAEIDLARSHSVIPVRLGPTLLRSETAGLVASTLVLAEYGVYA